MVARTHKRCGANVMLHFTNMALRYLMKTYGIRQVISQARVQTGQIAT